MKFSFDFSVENVMLIKSYCEFVINQVKKEYHKNQIQYLIVHRLHTSFLRHEAEETMF